MDLTTTISKAGSAYRLFASRAEKLGITTLEDLLFHFPFRYEDYTIQSPISQIQEGETVSVRGTVLESVTDYTRSRFKIQRVTLQDDSGMIQCTWFNQVYITQVIKAGDIISIAGKVESFRSKKTIMVKDYEKLPALDAPALHTRGLIPVYPETRGLSSKWIRNRIKEILSVNTFDEYLPDELLTKYNFISLDRALRRIHFPNSFQDIEQAKSRLSFDELFIMQLNVVKRRHEWEKTATTHAFDVKTHRNHINELISSLPFELTDSQKKAVEDILVDITHTKPMNRLLEGDVGSGKTVVGAIIMYAVYLNGYQSAMMAPTDILANQHHRTISQLLEPLGLSILLYTGATKRKMKEIGNFDIVIGTHALLDDKLIFDKLGFIAIDEQQRFGVEQRAILRNKGTSPHFLTMTATPIPRTVFLTMYGDLDLSYLKDMPKGRKKVKTWVVPEIKRPAAYEWIAHQLSKSDNGSSDQAFIVCPFIEESESAGTVRAAVKEYEHLASEVFPQFNVGLLHGKMKNAEKDETLRKLRDHEIDILVATPVVEVGIDIPDATIMVIEAAERFGLSQLHQLRGRVGRNDKESYCLLFSDSGTMQSITRLKNLERIYHGPELAEIDLKLRGPGDMYGTMQHGVPKLKIASFSDTELIEKSRNAAHTYFSSLESYPLLQEKLRSTIIQDVNPD